MRWAVIGWLTISVRPRLPAPEDTDVTDGFVNFACLGFGAKMGAVNETTADPTTPPPFEQHHDALH